MSTTEIATNTQPLDMNEFINAIAAELQETSANEKIQLAGDIRSHFSKIKNQRHQRIQNLTDQIKNMGASGGVCYKALRPIAKILDALSLPLSALSLGKLKTHFSELLESLKKAKDNDKFLGLKIIEGKIFKAIETLKKILADEFGSLDQHEDQFQEDASKLMSIIEEIEDTYQNSNPNK